MHDDVELRVLLIGFIAYKRYYTVGFAAGFNVKIAL